MQIVAECRKRGKTGYLNEHKSRLLSLFGRGRCKLAISRTFYLHYQLHKTSTQYMASLASETLGPPTDVSTSRIQWMEKLRPCLFPLFWVSLFWESGFWDKPVVWRIGCLNKLGVWQSWLFWVDSLSWVVNCLKCLWSWWYLIFLLNTRRIQ